MYLSIFITIALIAGCFIVWNISPAEMALSLTERFRRRPSIKDIALKSLGREKHSFIERQFLQAKHVLNMTERSGEYEHYRRLSYLCAVIGAGVGMAMLNPALALVFAAAGLLIPLFIVQLSVTGFKRESREELFASLSAVTSSFERLGDIIGAIEENIGHIGGTISPAFKELLRQYNIIDPDLHKAIRHVRPMIDHPLWCEWCDNLQMCVDDPSKRYVLRRTVQNCGKQNTLQNELDTILNRPMVEAIGVSVIVFANIPILSLMSSDFAWTMFHTIQGKLALGVIAAAILFMFYRAVRAARPIDEEEKTA